jgi:hypothetical protein
LEADLTNVITARLDANYLLDFVWILPVELEYI